MHQHHNGTSDDKGENKLKLRKAQRVFVNRQLNMGKIKAIGYDLDHTLVRYDREAFEALAFRVTVGKFIEQGYPEEFQALRYDPDHLIRGLLVDIDRGNVLKVDAHKYVKSAYHGHRRLSKDERQKLYNSQPYKAGEFLSVDTFFSLSEVQLFTEIVDFMANNPGRIRKTFREVYQDLRWLIDLAHADGSIKNEVRANLGRYIRKDKHLRATLERQIEAGKTLFLLTNSAYEYTDELLRFALSEQDGQSSEWLSLFEYVLVGAGKPGFFTGSQPFYEVMKDSGLLKRHSGPLTKGAVYHGGNAKSFERLTGYLGDEILFVGDHIYGDVAQSKGTVNWRTMLVVEELESELEVLEEQRPSLEAIRRLSAEREIVDEEIQLLHSRIAYSEKQVELLHKRGESKKAHYLQKENEKTLAKRAEKLVEQATLEQEFKARVHAREQAFHGKWGELMRAGLERSRFADQVKEYACIYSARANNLRFYSPFKRFSIASDTMPHEL